MSLGYGCKREVTCTTLIIGGKRQIRTESGYGTTIVLGMTILRFGVRGDMVLEGLTKWSMLGGGVMPITLTQQLSEEWFWLGVEPPDLTQQLLEEWDWLGYPTRDPPSMTQQVLEEWSS